MATSTVGPGSKTIENNLARMIPEIARYRNYNTTVAAVHLCIVNIATRDEVPAHQGTGLCRVSALHPKRRYLARHSTYKGALRAVLSRITVLCAHCCTRHIVHHVRHPELCRGANRQPTDRERQGQASTSHQHHPRLWTCTGSCSY